METNKKQITILSIREAGDEDEVHVFDGHLLKEDLKPTIRAWILGVLGDPDLYHEGEDYFVTLSHDWVIKPEPSIQALNEFVYKSKQKSQVGLSQKYILDTIYSAIDEAREKGSNPDQVLHLINSVLHHHLAMDGDECIFEL